MKMAIKKGIVALMVFFAGSALANDAIAPVDNLFDAMRAHDEQKLLLQFTADAVLQRAKNDGSTQTTDIRKFAKAIGQANAFLDEKLLSVSVHQSGNLASVWTPYVFYRDSELSHCGVNSFQLIHTAKGWKIHYLIDNVFTGNCDDFIATHSSP